MNAVYEAAAGLQEFVRDRGWPFCFIGGIAVQRWGYPRATDDADMTVLTRIERDDECIAALAGRFGLWFPNSVELAHRVRVLFLKHDNGVRMDVALGVMQFEENSIARASWWEVAAGIRLFTCCADDLIVHKAYADRALDWVDVQNIIAAQGAKLNVPQILSELGPLSLLKEDGGIITKLEGILSKRGLL